MLDVQRPLGGGAVKEIKSPEVRFVRLIRAVENDFPINHIARAITYHFNV